MPHWLSIISYPTRVRGKIVNLSSSVVSFLVGSFSFVVGSSWVVVNRSGVIVDRREVVVDLCRSFRVLITTVGVYQ